MSWVEPITDRTVDDIRARTAKAFLNVADWQRIVDNADVLAALILSVWGRVVVLGSLTPPTAVTVPTAQDINDLVTNLNLLRTDLHLMRVSALAALRCDYAGGTRSDGVNYATVNAWEWLEYTVKDAIDNIVWTGVYCGVARCGQPRTWQHRWRI
jgi:hypothetical protein